MMIPAGFCRLERSLYWNDNQNALFYLDVLQDIEKYSVLKSIQIINLRLERLALIISVKWLTPLSDTVVEYFPALDLAEY